MIIAVLRTVLLVTLAAMLLIVPISSPLFARGTSDSQDTADNVVHVYSSRHYENDDALFVAFKEQTGIEVQVVQAKADELIQRLLAEGENTPADLFITVDVARLTLAKDAGVLQPVSERNINALVPKHLRDSEGYWYAITMRSRIIAYNKVQSDISRLSTYEALAGPAFEGSVAIRSSSNVYNISLLSSLIEHNGLQAAKKWAEGMTRSFARPPQGNDRDQLRTVAAGQAEYAVVNTYYVGLMLSSDNPDDVKVGKSIGVFFPNQDSRGAHVNVSGAGLTRHADNPEGAKELLAFLLSDEAQASFAQQNFEFPVRDGIQLAPEISAMGDFLADTTSLSEIGKHGRDATKIFNEVGWP